MATVIISNHISAQGELISQSGDQATVLIGGGQMVTGRLVKADDARQLQAQIAKET